MPQQSIYCSTYDIAGLEHDAVSALHAPVRSSKKILTEYVFTSYLITFPSSPAPRILSPEVMSTLTTTEKRRYQGNVHAEDGEKHLRFNPTNPELNSPCTIAGCVQALRPSPAPIIHRS